MIDVNKISALLGRLEVILKESTLWSEVLADESVLNSQQPFCIDTMTGPQWLQWVFIPKMSILIDNQLPLPTRFAITPYFEQSLPTGHDPLLNVLRELDFLLNQE